MVFSNVVAYSKHWYKHNYEDVEDLWKDLVYCINADGWSVRNKREVASWCLTRMEEYDADIKKSRHSWGVRDFYTQMEKNKMIYNYYPNKEDKLSDEANIIWVYYDLLQGMSNDCFDKYYIPSNDVLPLNLGNAYVDDDGWHPAEMMSDRIEYVKNYFKTKDALEQDLYSFNKYSKKDIDEFLVSIF